MSKLIELRGMEAVHAARWWRSSGAFLRELPVVFRNQCCGYGLLKAYIGSGITDSARKAILRCPRCSKYFKMTKEFILTEKGWTKDAETKCPHK